MPSTSKCPGRLLILVLLGLTLPALAQYTQQGPKLVTHVPFNPPGESVSISADGNTAIVGVESNGITLETIWIWTRSDGGWTRQPASLVGSGAVGFARQASSVCLSGDGNTAIIGGAGDNGFAGAAWIFARSGEVWTQQGPKLVGSGAVGAAKQGSSVSLSADGNTAIVGGPGDNGSAGAAWVWIRSGGVWTQQGPKLVGSDATGIAAQGAVSLSADGNTAIVGGKSDNSGRGAAWVWARSGSVWTQQGTKLVGSGAVGVANQGYSVSISGDGNTAIVGGLSDNGFTGAAWVFTRSGGVWSQQGAKLAGSGASPSAFQGSSVSVSADGNTVIVGAPFDNSVTCCLGVGSDGTGAAWIWKRNGGVWTQQGSKLVGSGSNGPAEQGQSVALSADGTTAMIGGPHDADGPAVWVFVTGAELIPALSSLATVILLSSITLLALFRLK